MLSAINNYQQKNADANLEEAGLFVKTITVDGGMMLKDFVQLHKVVHTELESVLTTLTIVLGSNNNTQKQLINSMGQKTNPIGNRLGIIRGWDSNWYGGNDYGDKIAEDAKIRKYIHARLSKS